MTTWVSDSFCKEILTLKKSEFFKSEKIPYQERDEHVWPGE